MFGIYLYMYIYLYVHIKLSLKKSFHHGEREREKNENLERSAALVIVNNDAKEVELVEYGTQTSNFEKDRKRRKKSHGL